jgi:protein-tyrosine phosphatase
MSDRPISVLFVCLGNICRSPLAEAVFRGVVTEAGLEDRFRIDSAGTSGYHAGDPPDRRTAAVAARRGVTVDGRSRKMLASDLRAFDYVLVMDAENLRAVHRLAAGAGPGSAAGAGPGAAPEIRLFREFDPAADGDLDVPDPYYGGAGGFEEVHDLVERSARGLLDHIRQARGL